MKTLLTCLLCALYPVVAASAFAQTRATVRNPVHNINLTEARDIADAAAVNAAISVLVKAAASCPAATSKGRQACACSFNDELKKLKSAYDAAVTKHPRWNEVDDVVAYQDAANGKSVALNFSAIKRQLDACSQHQQ